MMRKYISLLIFDHSGSPVKRLVVAQKSLFLIGIGLAIGLALFVFAVIDYVSLKKIKAGAYLLEKKLACQEETIGFQENQIKDFAGTINELKSQLVALNEFERQIRVMANLDNKETEQDGVFGVGGSMPEDLDPTIGFKERRLGLLQDMHEQVQDLDEAYDAQHDRLKELYGHLEEQRNILASTPAIKPVDGGWYSSSFGYRKSPFTGKREFHKGLDICAKKGTPIYATADGVVTFAGKKGFMGRMITIDHGYGMITRYGHADNLLKKKGDKVKRGEIIAKVGNTGRSTGPHVHYEVKVNGVPVNPQKYILN